MVDSKLLIGLLVFAFVFYTFVGYATVYMDDDVRVEYDSSALENLGSVNASGIDTDDHWYTIDTYGRERSMLSLIWDVMTFRVFGLPSGVGFIFNFLVVTMISLMVILEILKYVRGV